jgi:hypothetical protein
MDVWTNQPYLTVRTLHTKNLEKKKKKGEIVEKYFPNNFQNTHVYKADIPVQLAFQKNQNIIAS